MSRNDKKTKKLTKADLAPENFKTREEHEEAIETYNQSQPIYIVLNFILGAPNKIKNNLSGKPGQPPY